VSPSQPASNAERAATPSNPSGPRNSNQPAEASDLNPSLRDPASHTSRQQQSSVRQVKYQSIPADVSTSAYPPSARDPLDEIEAAPQPPSILENWSQDPPSFPPQLSQEELAPELDEMDRRPDGIQPAPLPTPPRPWPQRSDEDAADAGPDRQESDIEEILRRAQLAASPDCSAVREQLRGQPLSAISLDVSPKTGDGLRALRSDKMLDEPQRMNERTTRALRREWTDYRGDYLATGRMVDLRFGQVVLDDGGRERSIPLVDLSDADWAYIADLWNLPFRCGSGYEPLEGRNFIASTVQWKASGACHNPLYFEQVQLERYGHEAGPFIQPLVSSAHFFLTIPMLPYKMAINPPGECQYALGYHRPGDCVPYMVQPFPWSLRAGLVQAGFWTGASTIFP
jgi:hypothetical protein